MSGNTIYSRLPLGTALGQIRLLKLEAGSWTDPLHAELVIVSIADGVEYATLSYVWGTEMSGHSIMVNGKEKFITSNLHAALKYLRAHLASQDQLIWVDAICINQDDSDEKSQQVGLMAQIYSNCKNVWTHLQVPPAAVQFGLDHSKNVETCSFSNDESDYDGKWEKYMLAFHHSRKVQRGLSTITEIREEHAIDMLLHFAWSLRLLSHGRHFTDIPPLSPPFSHDSPYFDALLTLWQQFGVADWLSRLWVVQEAVLAPRALIYIGHVSLDLSILKDVSENLRVHTAQGCCISSKPGHYQFRQAMRSFLQQMNHIHLLKRRGKWNHELLELGLMLINRQVGLQHDRIYALLGLLNNKIPSIEAPNYDMPIAKLYTQVSRDFIQRTHSLSLLSFTSIRNSHRNLPTWAIDWESLSDNGGLETRTWKQVVKLFEIGHIQQIPKVLPRDILEVDAIKFSAINDVTEPLRRNLSDIIDEKSWQLWTSLFSQYFQRHRQYVDGSSLKEVWWRTLCSDCCWGTTSARRLRPEDVLFFSQRMMKDFPYISWDGGSEAEAETQEHGKPLNPEAHFSDILRMLLSNVTNKRLLVTGNGYIGLAIVDAKTTDEIFVLPGCSTPLVLRKDNGLIAESDSSNSPIYRIVGSCFIHGIMDGEAFRPGTDALLHRILIA